MTTQRDVDLSEALDRVERYMKNAPNYLDVPIPESMKKGGVLCGGPFLREELRAARAKRGEAEDELC